MALCSCGQQAATQCRRQQCGRCCLGCAKHPRKLPPPGEPGSCECGNVAAPTCENWLCARCCPGCSRHPTQATDTESLAEAEERVCQQVYCQQQASPACDYQLCGSCCPGCSRHPAVVSDTMAELEAAEASGVCQQLYCQQVASSACDFALCGSCCPGCSRHPMVVTDTESVPEAAEGVCQQLYCQQQASPACDFALCGSCCPGCSRHPAQVTDTESVPEAAEGICQALHCQQLASPACDFALCGSCCQGCSRHATAVESEDFVCDEESDYAPPCPGEPGSCSCGQTASPACDHGLCASCCGGCSRHGYAATSEARQLAADPEPPAPQPQQQQPISCVCGRPAAQSCSTGRCAACCYSPYCQRHAAARSHQAAHLAEAGYDSDSDSDSDDEDEYATFLQRFAALSMQYGFAPLEPQLAAGLRVNRPLVPVAGIGAVPVVEQPAGSVPLRPGGCGAAGSSRVAAGSADTARGPQHCRTDQQSSAAGAGSSSKGRAAGPSSSSSSAAAAAAAVPSSQAEEELFQLKHCVVCLDAARSVLLLPCKHLVLCEGCMGRMQSVVRQDYMAGESMQEDVLCPVCRQPATAMLPGIVLS